MRFAETTPSDLHPTGEQEMPLPDFLRFVESELPHHLHESDALVSFCEAAEAEEEAQHKRRVVVQQHSREAVTWRHVAPALCRHGIPDAAPEPPPDDISRATLLHAFAEFEPELMAHWGGGAGGEAEASSPGTRSPGEGGEEGSAAGGTMMARLRALREMIASGAAVPQQGWYELRFLLSRRSLSEMYGGLHGGRGEAFGHIGVGTPQRLAQTM